MSTKEAKESSEADYDQDKDQLKDKQEEEQENLKQQIKFSNLSMPFFHMFFVSSQISFRLEVVIVKVQV